MLSVWQRLEDVFMLEVEITYPHPTKGRRRQRQDAIKSVNRYYHPLLTNGSKVLARLNFPLQGFDKLQVVTPKAGEVARVIADPISGLLIIPSTNIELVRICRNLVTLGEMTVQR